MTKRLLPPPPGPQWSPGSPTPQTAGRSPGAAQTVQPKGPGVVTPQRHAPPPVSWGTPPVQAGGVAQPAKWTKGKGKGKGKASAKKSEPRIPFPWRFSNSGERALRMEQVMVDMIASSLPTKMTKGMTVTFERKDGTHKSVAITNKRFADLTKTNKRHVSQVTVMFGLSPNKVADAAGFERGGGWEWLHLVAFSLGHQYVSSLSDDSVALFRKTKQQQQVSENLVLGTAAANTAMLEVEAAIKSALQGQRDLRLQLWTNATEHTCSATIDGDTWVFKVCSQIRYDFRFFKRYHDENGIEKERSSGAIIVTFDPSSHTQPLKTEYSEVHKKIVDFSTELYELPNPIQGIRTGFMVNME